MRKSVLASKRSQLSAEAAENSEFEDSLERVYCWHQKLFSPRHPVFIKINLIQDGAFSPVFGAGCARPLRLTVYEQAGSLES